MIGTGATAAEPFWQRRKVQAAALLLVVLLAWLAHYLENLPLARAATRQDALVTG